MEASLKYAKIWYDPNNYIEGEITYETESVIVIRDEMYGECRIRKEQDLEIIRSKE